MQHMTPFAFPHSLPPFINQPSGTQNLARQIRYFVSKELKVELRNQKCLLAVSGGADSLALLCLLSWLRPVLGHSLCLLHVDHGLRPESKIESQHIASLCEAWDVECYIKSANVLKIAKLHKMGIEEAARQERYRLFAEIREQCAAQWICLGHHSGDLQEDIIMRLIRGAGWPSLGGMVAVDVHRHILRPLLMLDPHDLRTMLESIGLSWMEDASNKDLHFLRNRVRHTLLPQLQAENPAFSLKSIDMWKLAQYDAAHWNSVTDSLFGCHSITVKDGKLMLPSKLLGGVNKATRLRLYMRAIREVEGADVHGGQPCGQARAQTLYSLDDALMEGRGGTTFQLPGRINAFLKKGSITFTKT